MVRRKLRLREALTIDSSQHLNSQRPTSPFPPFSFSVSTPQAPRQLSALKFPLPAFSLLLASLIFLYQSAPATEFVVKQQGATASDDNPGTEKQPLKTISGGAAKVHAGDKVIIHGGDYRETVIITASGTEEAPILFEAAPGETPVIKGSDIVKNWVLVTGSVWKATLPPVPK